MSTPCSYNGCPLEGLYPAPRDKDHPKPYLYFCLAHVREYNARWNFLQGLDETGIERRIREATVWERPTWPLGKGPVNINKAARKTNESQEIRHPPEILHCLSVLGLAAPSTLAAVKRRFRELAKKFHPDTNAGSQSKIARFHAVQEAFATLKAFYATTPQTQR